MFNVDSFNQCVAFYVFEVILINIHLKSIVAKIGLG